MEDFLPAELQETNKLPDGVSAIFSTQIGDSTSSQQQSQVLEDEPLSLEFTFNEVLLSPKIDCFIFAFFFFSLKMRLTLLVLSGNIHNRKA